MPEVQQKKEEIVFNPNEHLMQIKSGQTSQDYLPVQWRLVWFQLMNATGKITLTKSIIDLDREIEKEVSVWNADKRKSEKVLKRATGWAYYEVHVEDGNGKTADANGSESAVDFAEYIEKAYTKAVGRELAILGYGTQFTGEELQEGLRIVDAPVPHRESTPIVEQPTEVPAPVAEGTPIDPPSSEQQQSSIRKLYQELGREPQKDLEKLSYPAAKDLIASLSKEYREKRKNEPTGPRFPTIPAAEPPLEPAAPAVVVKATIVPKAEPVVTEDKEASEPDMMDEEDWSYILGLRNEIGPYEFKEVAKKVEAPLSLLEWEKTHVLAFMHEYDQWVNAGQQTWRDQKKNDFQGAELGKMVTTFTATYVGKLRDRIPSLKGIESRNLTQGQADILIGYGQKANYYLLIADKLNLDLGALFYKGQVSVLDFFENKARLANYGKFLVALQEKIEAHPDLPDEVTNTYRYLELNIEASRAKETQAA